MGPNMTKAHVNGRDTAFPSSTDVVVIGGGIAGVTTAFYLASEGVPVVLCEKGVIAGEQSSRNWGWIRKQGRKPREIPALIQALRLWQGLADAVDEDIGWKVGGVTFVADTEKDLAGFEAWLTHAREHQLDSRLLTADETDRLLRQDGRRFKGGITTPSDARAEPSKAVPAIARAAERLGAIVLEQCAVRTLERSTGRVSAVITEKGTITCNTVVLAGGAWSSLMLRHLSINLPQLMVKASAQRTTPAPLITESAVKAGDAAFRRRPDGGYTIARSGSTTFQITPDAFRHFTKFWPVMKQQINLIKLRLGRPFVDELLMPYQWAPDVITPFEQTRILSPSADDVLLDDVMTSARRLFPQLNEAKPVERWAGMIDVLPDESPVIGPVDGLEGLLVATGFSGHGFGFGPVAGHAVAALAQGKMPLFDLKDFRFNRFT